MTRVRSGIESRVSYLRRLAIVFADPLRLKIVTELYMREMSPTQFFREFGGGSVSRVDRHFQRLAKYGWLTLIRTESGGSRRGGNEHFYRATELAIFDTDTWSQLPYSIKATFSWRIFEQLAERVREAIEVGTFDARADRHLGWAPILLDRQGWERVIAAVDALFESLFEEQADAKLRLADSGEQPVFATVALAAFESPAAGPQNPPSLAPLAIESARSDSPIPFTLRLAKVFADEVSLKIVTVLNQREMSAKQFHNEFGGASVSGINRRFKMLAKIGWLTKVGEKSGGRRRGATEHFYRATGPAIYDSRSWAEVPDPVRSTDSWRIFEQLAERVREAMAAGTFDARPDRHHSWSLLLLDRLGWERAVSAIEALSRFVLAEQDSAERRLAGSGEEPVLATVALAAFESPQDSARAP